MESGEAVTMATDCGLEKVRSRTARWSKSERWWNMGVWANATAGRAKAKADTGRVIDVRTEVGMAVVAVAVLLVAAATG